MPSNFEQFSADMARQSRRMAQYISRDLPRVVGIEGVAFFKEGFEKEGFTDAGIEPWDEVKRRQSAKTKGAAKVRKILHGDTSELQNSIDFSANVNSVSFGSDMVYAEVHNNGGRAGRGAGFTMKKRQFIGHSATFDRDMINRLTLDLSRLLSS